MKILTLGTAILTVDVTETVTTWASPDQIIPKHIVPGAVLITVAQLPEDYQPNTYTYNGAFVRIPVVAVPPSLGEYISAMEEHYDTKAQERRYDNRLTCAIRAGYAGPFQAEGTAFAIWMDTCNALGYQIMAAVMTGARTPPTIGELISELPALMWPI